VQGRVVIDTGDSNYYLSITDTETATMGSEQKDATVTIDNNNDGKADRIFSGFSGFLGLNDFFVTNEDEYVYQSNVLSKTADLGVRNNVSLNIRTKGINAEVIINPADSLDDIVAKINNNEVINGKLMENIKNEEIEIYDREFENVIFNDVNIINSKFEKTTFKNIKFIHCNFSNTSFDSCSFIRCEFENCKLTGCNFLENRINNVSFIETNADYMNLSMASIDGILFNNTRLRNSYFQENKMKNVFFENTDLMQAQFFNTSLKNIDLSDCNIEGFSVSIEDIKGAIINQFQTVDLMYLLGVKLK